MFTSNACLHGLVGAVAAVLASVAHVGHSDALELLLAWEQGAVQPSAVEVTAVLVSASGAVHFAVAPKGWKLRLNFECHIFIYLYHV